MYRKTRTVKWGIAVFLLVFLSLGRISHASMAACPDRFCIKFVDGSHILRSMGPDSIMMVGIGSVDELSQVHQVSFYEKIGRDYQENEKGGLVYEVHFKQAKTDIEAVRAEFENDPYVEFARVEYTGDSTCTDYFFDFAPNNSWPCPGDQNCGPYPTTWGDAWVEQWPLHNDGDIYANTQSCVYPRIETFDWDDNGNYVPPVSDEDLGAAEAWDYYQETTPEDPDIPGDPEAVLGHLDTGISKKNVELLASLYYDSQEDHGNPYSFDPNQWCYNDIGDKGSPTGMWPNTQPNDPPVSWDGVPGDPGDDDQDTYSDWFDPGISEIMWDNVNNDYDGNANDEPGGTHCDCPVELTTTPGLLKPDGTPYTLSDIGTPGEDDDGDGWIDECDGAMWDDDEDGYVDDVIGWDFAQNDNNPLTDVANPNGWDVHGSETAGLSVARGGNSDPEVPPQNPCPSIPVINDNMPDLRVGFMGVCPDCRFMELKIGGFNMNALEPILFARHQSIGPENRKVMTFVQAAWPPYLGAYLPLMYDMGCLYISTSGYRPHAYSDCDNCDPGQPGGFDDPFCVVVTGTKPNGYCMSATCGRFNDIAAPSGALLSTCYPVLSGNDDLKWYRKSIAWIPPGTSLACQFVAGAAVLLQSYSNYHDLGWTNGDIMARLINGSRRYEPGYFENYSRNYSGPNWMPIGVGRLDVNGSLTTTDPYGAPNPILQNMVIDRVGPGNHDGVISQGEEVGIYFQIFNYGGPIINPTMTLICDDPNVQIVNGSLTSILFPPYQNSSNESSPFTVQILSNAIPGHAVDFQVQLSGSNMETWQSPSSAQGGSIISLEEIYSIPTGVFASYPAVGELDSDARPEAVVVGTGFIKAVNAENGSTYWQNSNYGAHYFEQGPAIGDINGDGLNEVVFISGYPTFLRVLNGQTGALMSSVPIERMFYYQPPVLADWYPYDADLEVLAVDGFDFVHIFDFVGGNLNEIEQLDYPEAYFNGISVGDVNNDGLVDAILTGAMSNPVICIFDNFSRSITYEYHEGDGAMGPASVADLDDDGQLEFVCLDGSGAAKMFDYVNGQWIATTLYQNQSGSFANEQTTVGDWNNDGVLEVFFFDLLFHQIKAYHSDGNGDSFSGNGGFGGYEFLKSGDIEIADLNSDGYADLFFRGEPSANKTWGLSHTGNSLWGESNCTVFLADKALKYTVPVIGDMDLDGALEILSQSYASTEDGEIELFDPDGQNYEGALQWPQYRHDARRTSLYSQPVKDILYVSEDMTIWNDMVVWDGIDVEPGATLTIKPGVNLKFKPSAYLTIRGNLNAIGTASEPITFSCTNPYPSSRWYGIDVGSSANVHLNRCSIKHATYGIRALDAVNSITTIENTTINDMLYTGILDYNGNVILSQSQVSNCASAGIELHNGLLNAHDNTISNTGSYGIKLYYSAGASTDSSYILANKIYRSSKLVGSIGILCDHSNRASIRENALSGFDQAGLRFQYSSPNIKKNTITDITYNGMFFANSSSPNFVQRNEVFKVQRAAWCETNSYPILGTDQGANYWGNNSFHDFSKPPVENHNNSYNPPIYAQRNWWGFPSYCPGFTTNVICTPALTAPPLLRPSTQQVGLPTQFSLHQNYPNPFNSTTTIKFDVPAASYVTIRVFNILGQEVARPHDGYLPAGYHSIIWDGRNSSGSTVSSGIYIYNIMAGDFRESKKMTILK